MKIAIRMCGGGRTRRASAYSLCRSDSRLCWCAEHRNLTIRTEERNRNEYSHLSPSSEKPLLVVSVGCGLHARVPQLKPLPDVVHGTTNGTAMEGAVAMELGARYFVCRDDDGNGKKSPPKITSRCLRTLVRKPQPHHDAARRATNRTVIEGARTG